MSWGKVDDRLFSHPKVVALGALMLPALGLWLRAFSWVCAYLTDGVIPAEQVFSLAEGRRKGQPLASALVASGLWEEVPGGYRFHDFHDYNPSSVQVAEERSRRKVVAEAGGKARAASANREGGRFAPSADGASPENQPLDQPASQPKTSRAAGAEVVARTERSQQTSSPVPAPVPAPAPSQEDEGRMDIVALCKAKGVGSLSRAQRRVLDEILDHHDVTGPAWSAAVIASAPPDVDAMDHLLAEQRRWLDARNQNADEADHHWADEKEREAAEAASATDRFRAMANDPSIDERTRDEVAKLLSFVGREWGGGRSEGGSVLPSAPSGTVQPVGARTTRADSPSAGAEEERQ